jgi:6-phosphogluconolactonase (cycloisomerase 2 family)
LTARLVVEAGPAAGSALEVTGRLVLGRAESGVGTLGDDPELSRRHASITQTDTALVIEDLGSRNGTVVAGRRITRPVEVAVGDLIEVGTSRLRVESTGARVAPAPAAAQVPAPPAPAAAQVPAPPAPVAAQVPGPPAPVEPARVAPGRVAPAAAPPPGRVAPASAPPPPAPPPVAIRARGRIGVIAAIVIATLVIVAVQLLTRGPGVVIPGSGGLVAGVDGTIYVETDVAQPDQNSVLAIQYRSGLLRPLTIHEYLTGGSGAADLEDRGILDGDQQLAVNADGTLLFAVNQGSDSVAVFAIGDDGSLRPVPGSPFPSGGIAPISLGVDGNLLVVANKAVDGVRNLTGRSADYATMFIGADGALTPTGHTVQLRPGSSPTQSLIAPGGRLLIGSVETGYLQIYAIDTATGALTPADGSPYPVPASARTRLAPSEPVWPAGISVNPDHSVLYTGIPNADDIASYTYSSSTGRASLDSLVTDPKAQLPCWSIVSPNGQVLYFANAGSDSISVWNIATDPTRPTLIQTMTLPGGGNPWGLRIDPDGRYLYVLDPRQVASVVAAGEGQTLHALEIGANGTLTEMPGSPVPLPVGFDTNPVGVVVVAAR